MENIDPIKINLLNTLEEELKELEVDMSISCITSTPYVLCISEMYISPEFKDHTTTGKTKWSMNPLRATRFSKEDAEMLASVLRNGAGETGKAVGIYQAVRSRHATITALIETLSK